LTARPTIDADRNLLLGVRVLQAGLIDAGQFAEACQAWAAQPGRLLAEIFVERGWLTPAARADLERQLDPVAVAAGAVDLSAATLSGLPLSGVLTGRPQPEESTPPVPYVPATRERYTLIRLHATGGSGRIWLAWDDHLGREVALKELREEHARDPRHWSRLLREARVTSQLEHPGVVAVYELGQRPGSRQPFYTMRFVKGRTLTRAARAYHRQRAAGETSPRGLLPLLHAFVMVCDTVAYAHARGVIHRDLKGQNVLLGEQGEVLVLDWGLAEVLGPETCATETPGVVVDPDSVPPPGVGQVLGTPPYMAPEQAAGWADRIDHRSDVYGLGAILYEILTGRPPFAGSDTEEILSKVLEEEPLPPHQVWPDVPPVLEAVCLRALSKKPADRYAAACDLAGAVRHWLGPVHATPTCTPGCQGLLAGSERGTGQSGHSAFLRNAE
jgi:tRNA A-37 threonylcarbamoyl transferase component Bud32